MASSRVDSPDSSDSAEVGHAASMETLDSYWKLGDDCVVAVQKTSNSRKFNNEQCGYLVDKLQVVVQSASLFLEVLRAEHRGLRSYVDVAKQVETFKLLLALAKQVESFVQGCCKDSWIQSAMTLTNVWEYVASVGFHMELCRVAFCMECAATGGLTVNEVEEIHKAEVEVVKKKASADVDTLFEKVILEMPSLSSENKDLACYLIQRLKQVKPIPASGLHVSGSPPEGSNGCDGGFLGRLFKWVKPGGQLGRGASGTVDKAIWLGTPVAKKTFYGAENPDFMKEVEVLSPLCHPNVMSVFCSAKNKKSCSIIMELMDEDLYTLMQRRLEENNPPPFSILEAIDIMLQIGEGVKYLHNGRVVHRDLKSMNILVKIFTGKDLDGYVHAKVADFGLSRTKEKSVRYSSMTYNVGSSRWMPPEIIKLDTSDTGSSTMTRTQKHPMKCDSYSFGMVCFEILTGDIPYPTVHDLKEVKKLIIQGQRPELPKDCKNCPPMLKDLIEKCWSWNPEERPTFSIICSVLKYMKYSLMRSDKYWDIPLEDEDSKVIVINNRLIIDARCGSTSTAIEGCDPLNPTVPPIVGIVDEDELQKIGKTQEIIGEPKDVLHGIAFGPVFDNCGSSHDNEFPLVGTLSGPLGSLHRDTAVRMVRDYLSDLTDFNKSLDKNVTKRVEENRAFLEELNQQESNSPLSWQERDKLSLMLKDYQTALSAALEDQDDDDEVEQQRRQQQQHGVANVEFKTEKDVNDEVPLTLNVGNFSSGSDVNELASSSDKELPPSMKLSDPLSSFHRGTAIRMLTDYLSDLTDLNNPLDENISRRIEEHRAFLEELREANQREPNSAVTWQERDKLSLMLKDYQTALSAALEDQEKEEEEEEQGVTDVELYTEEDVTDEVPLILNEAKFSSGRYLDVLTVALDLCERQVGELKKLLPVVRVFHHQCKSLVETLEPIAEKQFERCHKVLDTLKGLEINGNGVSTGAPLKSVHFCFESLVELARSFQLVVDLLRKCASENLHRTALELADLPPQPLMPKRWSEFSLAIRNCEWIMDLVEFAFYTLDKLLAGGTHIFQDVSFKWSEEKSRMVLQIPWGMLGRLNSRLEKLGRQGSRLEKHVLSDSKKLEKKDLENLVEQLRQLGESANSGSNWKLSGLLSRAAHNRAQVAEFLSGKLAGPIPHARYLPWTFRVEPDTLKFREYLDSGGAGMVGKYTWHGENVAVKNVRSPGLTRNKFEEEAAILASVQHPNVVRLIGCGFIDKKPGTGMLVMELMDQDLRTVIETRSQERLPTGCGPFTALAAIDIIMQIAQAMKHLRDHKVLHRDLKAKNILVNINTPLNSCSCMHPDESTVLPHTQDSYVVKLADFGLAKCRPHSSWVRTRMAGTTGWRAPEVFHVQDTEVSQQYRWPADVYSFGMTCYEILTGDLPFANLPNQTIYESIMAGKRPEGLDELDIPELLKDLVKKCWATNPETRPTFDEIVKAVWECRLKAILPGFERQISVSRSSHF
ncbi:hypothetical protein M758_7G098000 [Ceratodon purpureus]|nr:hypothetical protein M758_7G098000 [Ceratodon purpureus]